MHPKDRPPINRRSIERVLKASFLPRLHALADGSDIDRADIIKAAIASYERSRVRLFSGAYPKPANNLELELIEIVDEAVNIGTITSTKPSGSARQRQISEGGYRKVHMATNTPKRHGPTRQGTDFIVRFLDSLKRPVSLNEIRAALNESEIHIHDSSLTWLLSNLTMDGRIRRVARAVYATSKAPIVVEPAAGPGPQYHPKNGKLAEIPSPPKDDEVEAQSRLHRILSSDAAALANTIKRVANRYPELANTAEEYSALLNVELAAADVVSIWSVGGSLASFARSYREQNAARTLAEPLEPQLDALLQGVVRQHGAFIMGFEEGRDLVRRADEFAVDTLVSKKSRRPAQVYLTS